MSRAKLILTLTASFLSIVAATSTTYALSAPTMNLGLLRPAEKWKVGTVNADQSGTAYCAMVGQFEKRVVLAFARNPDGYGSIAVDFRERFFKPEMEYEVTLRPENGKNYDFVAKASSDRSVVIQVGQNDGFYHALGRDGALDIAFPTIDVSFALRRFSSSYDALLDCAGKLDAESASFASPVKNVEALALAPIDREVALLSDVDKKHDVLKQQLDAQQQKIAALETALQTAEASSLKEKVAEKEKAISLIEQVKAEEAAKRLEEFSKKEGALTSTLASLTSERDALQAELEKSRRGAEGLQALEGENKSLKAELIAVQAKLADVQGAQVRAVDDLTQKLATTQIDYEAKLADLVAKRDDLKTKLDAALAENASLKLAAQTAEGDKNLLSDLSAKLRAAEAEKATLAERITAQERQNKILEAALSGKEKELAEKKQVSSEGVSRLENIQGELASLRAEHEKTVLTLKAQLNDKIAQYEELKTSQSQELAEAKENASRLEKELASAQKELATASAKAVTASQKTSEIDQKIVTLEMARKSESDKAARALADLERARREIEDMKARPAPEARVEQEPVPEKTSALVPMEEAPSLPAVKVPAVEEKVAVLEQQLAAKEQALYEALQVTVEPAAGEDVPAVEAEQETVEQETVEQEIVVAKPVEADAERPHARGKAKGIWGFLKSGGYAEPREEKIYEAKPAALPPKAEEKQAEAEDPAVAPAPTGHSNAAASFLDEIMAYHKDGGYESVSPEEPEQEVKLPAKDTEMELVRKVKKKDPRQVAKRISGPVTLEAAVNSAGVPVTAFSPVEANAGEIIYQWKAGHTGGGMYEQMPSDGRFQFRDKVESYLDRYRDDCGQDLDLRVPAFEKVKAGLLLMADAECIAPSNRYVNSFVFFQNDDGFGVILHTGLPEGKNAVRDVRNAIAETLRQADRFILPGSVGLPRLSPSGGESVEPSGLETPDAPLQLRLNVPPMDETAADSGAVADLETIVIQ